MTDDKALYGRRSTSSSSGRAVPALPIIGEMTGAAHERSAHPWLARDDCGGPTFDLPGMIYLVVQSFDAVPQLVELRRRDKALKGGERKEKRASELQVQV